MAGYDGAGLLAHVLSGGKGMLTRGIGSMLMEDARLADIRQATQAAIAGAGPRPEGNSQRPDGSWNTGLFGGDLLRSGSPAGLAMSQPYLMQSASIYNQQAMQQRALAQNMQQFNTARQDATQAREQTAQIAAQVKYDTPNPAAVEQVESAIGTGVQMTNLLKQSEALLAGIAKDEKGTMTDSERQELNAMSKQFTSDWAKTITAGGGAVSGFEFDIPEEQFSSDRFDRFRVMDPGYLTGGQAEKWAKQKAALLQARARLAIAGNAMTEQMQAYAGVSRVTDVRLAAADKLLHPAFKDADMRQRWGQHLDPVERTKQSKQAVPAGYQ